MISYLLVNEGEAKTLSGMAETDRVLAYFKETYPNLKLLLTLGKKGCIYQDKDQQVYQPIFKVKAVDTTAAGDTFTGYFITGIAAGEDIRETLKIASCASAIAVSRKGAAPSIPTRKEVMENINLLEPSSFDVKTEKTRNQISQYIHHHIETASIQELATILGFSTVYTCSLVKKTTGRSFHKLLQEQRLLLASQLLLETDLAVNEIIKQVGYENESFFRKLFKAQFGETPVAYRKRKSKL